MKDGYVVIDDFLEERWASALQAEMSFLASNGHMKPNKTQFTNPKDGSVAQYSKPNIYEADMHDRSLHTLGIDALVTLFQQQALSTALETRMPMSQLVHGESGHTVKLQYNAGSGGCFPCHYDNPGRPNKRLFTVLMYLNPEWKEGDGGEVCLMPFLKEEVKVEPLFNRCVIFYSHRMLHRVLPNEAERYVVTVWIDSHNVNTPEETSLRIGPELLSDWMSLCEYLRQSACQRLISRAVYEEEYEESLRLCMEGQEGYEFMKEAHDSQMEKLRKNKGIMALVQRLRDSKFLF